MSTAHKGMRPHLEHRHQQLVHLVRGPPELVTTEGPEQLQIWSSMCELFLHTQRSTIRCWDTYPRERTVLIQGLLV